MNIKTTRIKASSAAEVLPATLSKQQVELRELGLSSRQNQKALERDALRSSWVYSNVDVIAKLVSQTEIGVWEIHAGEESKPIANHPFEMLLRKPNEFMGSTFFKRYVIMWLLLRGESYIMLSTDKTGELTELWPLPADLMEPVPDEKNYISHYIMKRTDDTQKPIPIPAQNICYIRLPNPFDYHRGLSPISAFALALETDKHAARWNYDTFTNEAVLRTMISVPPTISRGQFAKIKEEIVDELINRGKRYMVSRGGQLTVSQIGLSHKDMEYLRGREFTREEIDRVYGFPAGFWAKEATEANSRTARETLIELAVWPVLKMLGDDFKSQILDRYYNESQEDDHAVTLEVRPEDIRAKNVELETQALEFEYQTMTIDEVRVNQGRKPYGTAFGQVPWALREKEDFVVAYLQSQGQFPLGTYPGITRPEVPGLVEINVPDQGNEQVAVGAPIESGLLTELVLDERFTKAADDMKKWERMNVKALKREDGLRLSFSSDFMTEDEIQEIGDELVKANNIGEVKRLFEFAKRWIGEGQSDYVLLSDYLKKKP